MLLKEKHATCQVSRQWRKTETDAYAFHTQWMDLIVETLEFKLGALFFLVLCHRN